jgi:hypothetical protein
MDISQKLALLADVRHNISATEREIAELRRIEAYLASAVGELNGATSARPAGFAQPGGVAPANFTAEQIRICAKRALGAAGHPLKAIEIVRRELLPDYDPGIDNRRLENRVYSALKRQVGAFEKDETGAWSLRVDP